MVLMVQTIEIPRPSGTPFRKGDGRQRFLERSDLIQTMMPMLRAFLLEKGVPRNEAGDFVSYQVPTQC